MKGIIINSDSDGILKYIGHPEALPTTVEDVRHFAREFANTHQEVHGQTVQRLHR